MIGSSKVLALIPARGGSKRLKSKNVLPFAGKPLISWTVEAALSSVTVDRVILSSDDPEIIAAARSSGCEVPFMRPPELATDAASSMDVVIHALQSVGPGYGILVLLQPTSPLRTAADIDACVRLCAEPGTNGAVSVSPPSKPKEFFGLRDGDGRFTTLKSAEPGELCMLNGAVYAARIEVLLRNRSFYDDTTQAYAMPADRSVDIDTIEDFRMAEALARPLALSDAG